MKKKRSFLIELALLFAPREFREGYREAFGAGGGIRDALDVAFVGISLRCESLGRDLLLAIRSLAKSPLFTAVVVLTLALVVSANTVVFGAIDAVLLKPLPFVQPDHLVFFCNHTEETSCAGYGTPAGLKTIFATESRTLESVAAYSVMNLTLTGHGTPMSLQAYGVSDNIFHVLRVQPELGRFFVRKHSLEDAVISDSLWRSEFGGDRRVIGQTAMLDGHVWRIIGVAPPQTVMPLVWGPPRTEKTLWFCFPPRVYSQMSLGYGGQLVARTNTNAPLEAVRNDVQRIMQQVRSTYPSQLKYVRLEVVSFDDKFHSQSRALLLLALTAVLAVLIIASANVANLLFVRDMRRAGELATRSAIGASRRSIAQQLGVEVSVLMVLGGLLGLFFAYIELAVLRAIGSEAIIPGSENASIEARVLLMTFAAVAFATVASGLLPTLNATGMNLANALKSFGRGADPGLTRRVRTGLAATQVALAFTVVVASGLLYRSFVSATGAGAGMDTNGVYWASAMLMTPRYDKSSARSSFVNRVVAGVKALPGVAFAAIARGNPYLSFGHEGQGFRLSGRPYSNDLYSDTFASPGVIAQLTPHYFELLRMPLLEGREFTDHDEVSSARVVIVDRSFSRTYLKGRDPVGETIFLPRIAADTLRSTQRDPSWFARFTPARIVGVVGNVPTPNGIPYTWLYLPESQFPGRIAEIFVRMRVPDPLLRKHIAEVVASVDPQEALTDFDSLQNKIDQEFIAQYRAAAVLVGMIAFIALFIALAGIYAVLGFSVEQRQHEIGIRLAIGATQGDIVRDVVLDGLLIAALGISAGVVLAAISTRMLSNLLLGVSNLDVWTFVGTIFLLLASVVVASLIPALRAAKLQPMDALRHE